MPTKENASRYMVHRKRFWWIWFLFLAVSTPLTYQATDMDVWLLSIDRLANGNPLPTSYVYFPIFAQTLALLTVPFQMLHFYSSAIGIIIIHWFCLVGYIIAISAAQKLIPETPLAPVLIAFAPVTIFYLYWGANHILMVAALLLAIYSLKNGRFLLSGLMAALSCYKFLLIPTIGVLSVYLLLTQPKKKFMAFVAGGFLALIPSIMYYAQHLDLVARTLENKASLGGWSQQLDPFHVFRPMALIIPSFSTWYLQNQNWFFFVCIGAVIALIGLIIKKLTLLQSLGVCYGFTTLFAPEPFRMEPFIGLMWLDAVYRGDTSQSSNLIILVLVHALTWISGITPRALEINEAARVISAFRGPLLAIPLFITIASAFRGYAKPEIIVRAT